MVQYAKKYAQSQKKGLRSYTGEALAVEFENGVFYERPVYLASVHKSEPSEQATLSQGESEGNRNSKNDSLENGGRNLQTEDS